MKLLLNGSSTSPEQKVPLQTAGNRSQNVSFQAKKYGKATDYKTVYCATKVSVINDYNVEKKNTRSEIRSFFLLFCYSEEW